ncbi:MAG: hypothetical protein ACYCQI_10810 [Gammaproteobacteria bacterium]
MLRTTVEAEVKSNPEPPKSLELKQVAQIREIRHLYTVNVLKSGRILASTGTGVGIWDLSKPEKPTHFEKYPEGACIWYGETEEALRCRNKVLVAAQDQVDYTFKTPEECFLNEFKDFSPQVYADVFYKKIGYPRFHLGEKLHALMLSEDEALILVLEHPPAGTQGWTRKRYVCKRIANVSGVTFEAKEVTLSDAIVLDKLPGPMKLISQNRLLIGTPQTEAGLQLFESQYESKENKISADSTQITMRKILGQDSKTGQTQLDVLKRRGQLTHVLRSSDDECIAIYFDAHLRESTIVKYNLNTNKVESYLHDYISRLIPLIPEKVFLCQAHDPRYSEIQYSRILDVTNMTLEPIALGDFVVFDIMPSGRLVGISENAKGILVVEPPEQIKKHLDAAKNVFTHTVVQQLPESTQKKLFPPLWNIVGEYTDARNVAALPEKALQFRLFKEPVIEPKKLQPANVKACCVIM